MVWGALHPRDTHRGICADPREKHPRRALLIRTDLRPFPGGGARGHQREDRAPSEQRAEPPLPSASPISTCAGRSHRTKAGTLMK